MLPRLKILRKKSGSVAILAAVAFVAVCAIAAIVFDLGSVYIAKSDLQSAADAAALAAAYDLPVTDTARSTALSYAAKNGVLTGTTATTPYAGDANKIEVICTKTVQHTFAQVLGFSETVIMARAVAAKESAGAAFDYALFSGNASAPLSLTGSGEYVNGNAHSNYKFTITGSSQTVTGSAEAVNQFSMTGSSITIGGICRGSSISTSGSKIQVGSKVISAAPWVDMPDFSAAIKSQAEAAGQLYVGNKTFNGSFTSISAPLYVDGNVTVTGSSFSGKGCILATGSITFNGNCLTCKTGDALCFYSKTGNISITGSNAVVNGILFAPKGTVAITGSSVTINGRVIADKVSITGSNCKIISGVSDIGSLPKSTVKLAE